MKSRSSGGLFGVAAVGRGAWGGCLLAMWLLVGVAVAQDKSGPAKSDKGDAKPKPATTEDDPFAAPAPAAKAPAKSPDDSGQPPKAKKSDSDSSDEQKTPEAKKGTDAQSPAAKNPDATTPDAKAPNPKAANSKGSDTKGSDAKASDAKGADAKNAPADSKGDKKGDNKAAAPDKGAKPDQNGKLVPLNQGEPTDLKTSEPELTPGDAEFNHGKELADAGKYEEAIEQFKKALKLSAKETKPEKYVALGDAYRMLDRYDDAIPAYSDALEIDPLNGDAFLHRGICWFHKKEYGLATDDFDDASGIPAPDGKPDAKPFTWKGIALAQDGKWLDAVNVYSIALRYDNRYELAHVNRGLAYVAMHDYTKAVDDFNEAINLAPREAALYFKRGIAQTGLEDWKAAVHSYSEAIRLDPKYVDAFKNRGLAYGNLGDTQLAAEDEQTARELARAAELDAAAAKEKESAGPSDSQAPDAAAKESKPAIDHDAPAPKKADQPK